MNPVIIYQPFGFRAFDPKIVGHLWWKRQADEIHRCYMCGYETNSGYRFPLFDYRNTPYGFMTKELFIKLFGESLSILAEITLMTIDFDHGVLTAYLNVCKTCAPCESDAKLLAVEWQDKWLTSKKNKRGTNEVGDNTK